MTAPPEIAACLKELKPARLQAIDLIHQLITGADGRLDAGQFLAIAPQIEAALHQAERVSKHSRRTLDRCLTLKPVPHSKIPRGF